MKKSGKILLGIGGGLLVATGAHAHISIASAPATANVTQEVTFGKAASSANKTHWCEHAWGKLGLDECETL